MRVVRAVFYLEVISNLGSAVFALLFPAAFLRQLVLEPLPVAGVEFARWYAVVLVVLSLVLLAALRSGEDRFLRPVIGAYLLGDLLQIGVCLRFALAVGALTTAVHAALWSSVFYALVRVYYLARSR